ncbi:hypothetical protein RDABS01_006694, partial [Bienertia sinuspersici]
MRLKRRLGFKNGVCVDAKGRSGGLAMLWTEDVEVTLRKIGDRVIDVMVKEERLHDLGANGYPFTWSNKRSGDDLIEERLDRVLANGEWRAEFSQAHVTNMIWDCSDHIPIVLKLKGENRQPPHTTQSRVFRFEAKWLQVDCFEDKMHNFLNEALEGGANDWSSVMQTCEQMLRDWDQSTFRQVSRKIQWLKKRLTRLHDERSCWREDVLQEVFLPIDLERIRSIPISSRLPDDVWYWNGSKDGEFRVRDAYRMAIMEDRASSSNGADPIWNKIWKLKVPPKVRLFVWRACWDILPHNCNLAKRRVKAERGCVRCGMEEDNLHILRDCCWTKKIWEGKRASWCKLEASSFREWLAGVSSENKNGELEAMVMITWSIWNAINELVFEDIYRSPEACCMKALDMLQEYQKANDKPHQTKGRTEAKWQPPDAGVIKVNFDAAINKDFGRVGLGIISRNSDGQVVFAKARTMCYDWSPELGEARAALEAMKVAKDEGFSKIDVEGDSLVVIQAYQRRAKRSGPVQLLVEDAIALSSQFDSLSFGFCFRDCNQAAHRLAKWATSSFCDEVWHEGGPPWKYDI